jgi:hypothetical protein
VAVLPQEDHPVRVVQSHHRHGTGMPDDVAHAVPAAGHGHPLAVQRDDRPVEDGLPVEDPVLVRRRLPRRLLGPHQMPTFSVSSTSTGSREDSE